MRFFEYGNRENQKILLIHGLNIPWQMWMPQIEHFSKQYFVIVPALDGHISEDKSIFIDIQKAASDIEKYYIEQYGNEVFTVCGMSMGGTIGAAIWSNGNIQIKKLILESAPLVPMNPLFTSIFIKQNLSLIHKVQQRDQRTIKACEQMYAKSLLPHILDMIDSMDDKTIVNGVSSFGRYRLPANIKNDRTDIVFYHGTVFMEIIAKKSARYLKKHYPQVEVTSFQGYHHCELSVNHPERYIKEAELFFSK